MATPPSTLTGRKRKTSGQSAKGGDAEELSVSESEGGGAKDEELCGTSANQINEQMQRMLNQLYAFLPFATHRGRSNVRLDSHCHVFFFQEGVRVRGRLRQSGLGGDRRDSAAVGGFSRILVRPGQPGGGMCSAFYCFCMSTTTRHSWIIEAIPVSSAASGGIH